MTEASSERHFNAYVFPYKYASPGDEVVVRQTNLDDVWTESDYREDSSCEYTNLDSLDGEPNGLLVEWYEIMGMWTVYFYNPHAPALRRFQTRYDIDKYSWGCWDKEEAKFVGHSATEAGVKMMARKRNEQV